MHVCEAVDSRATIREFLKTPVPDTVLKTLLERAARAPSGGNVQPWHTHVLRGPALDRFKQEVQQTLATHPRGGEPEFHVYPPDLQPHYHARRVRCAEMMYELLGIERTDKPARHKHFAKNFEFFGAPVALFFSIDRNMGYPQWAHMGMYLQTIMLLAREQGLDTAPQECWAVWPELVSAFLSLPDDRMPYCGMALGYRDPAAPVNRLRTERVPQETNVQWLV